MPPPLPSESESESEFQDWLGDEPLDPVNGSAPERSREAEEPGDSVSDAGLDSHPAWMRQSGLSPSVKRKAETGSGDGGHPAKVPRTSPGTAGNIKAEISDGETDSAGYDSSDGDGDIPPNGVYLNQSFSADQGPTPNGSTVTHTETALQLFKRMYPLITPQPERPGNLFTYLAALPVKRIPAVTLGFNDSKPQNQVAFLMQAGGDQVPEHEVCAKCANRSGVFHGVCVVVRDPAVAAVTGGACATCWYGRQGSLCTFRPPRERSEGSVKVDPAKEVPASTWKLPSVSEPVAQLLPEVLAGVPASAPLHPSFAAALASGAVGATPSPAATSNGVLAGAGSLSRDDKIQAWENRYAKMNTGDLRRAHEHLAEWQEDLTTRLVAMNRVVLMRLKEVEGFTQ